MLKPSICVLMTCFNRKEKTINCVVSLIDKNPSLQFKFVIVDDGSTDGTTEALIELNNKDINIVKGTGNLYYSGGMRLAIETAKESSITADYYMLANDDVQFYDSAIEKLVAYCNDNISVGMTDDGEGRMTYGGVISCSKWRPSLKKVTPNKGEILHVDTFNANCVLIPSDIFMKLDNIDTHYVHGFGDYDYGLSAKRKGIDIILPDLFVGMCKKNPKKGSWQDKDLPVKERIQRKEKPNGSPSKIWFYFSKKNFSTIGAIGMVCIQYIRFILHK